MDQPGETVLQTSTPTVERVLHYDSPIASVEHDRFDVEEPVSSGRDSSGPEEAVFDNTIDDHHSSSGTSHHSDDDISEIPPDSRAQSCAPEREPSVLYTPHKQRSPFRNPSSVRAIQLDTTPPHLVSGSTQQKYRLSNASINSTPRSMRSHHSNMRSARSSPTKKVRKEYPLVLLHVTLLPVVFPYSIEIMESVLPGYVLENWKLLGEKISDTVLERGILIPHPREDYDLLEERLLESLELKMPRILKCGHFHLSPEEEEDILSLEDEYDSDEDVDICEDCGRRTRDGRYGSGTGNRRWDLKIYASNGLMRAGAWGAAWREMERVDVEILPWIDDVMRRELEHKQEEQIGHEAEIPSHMEPDPLSMDEERRREIYGDSAQAFVNGFANSPKRGPVQRKHQVPLSELFMSYIQQVLQDRRNVVIVLLSVAVLCFALGSSRNPTTALKADLQRLMTSEIEEPPIVVISALPSAIPNELADASVLAASQASSPTPQSTESTFDQVVKKATGIDQDATLVQLNS